MTLPAVAVYGIAVWLAAGLPQGHWWIQFASFALSTYLMVELNNSNALIRIYSRMVSCTYIVLSAAACFMFDSVSESIAGTFVIAASLTLFRCYQNRAATGLTFYTFLFLSLASLFYVHILVLIPVVWVMMTFYVQSMSGRNLMASIIGAATPYWFAAPYFIYTRDLLTPAAHFAALTDVTFPFDYTTLTTGQTAMFALLMTFAITGIVHYLRTSYNDKIRIRMIYNCFILMTLLAAALLVAMPQHYDMLTRIIIINASPLAAHFIALTRTRITNIAFILMVTAAILTTGYNLWTSSSIF